MKHTRAALLAGLTITAASVGAFVPAHAADSGNTVVTFTLNGGDLEVSAPANATLTDAAVTDTFVSGSLGQVSVNDARGALNLGYEVTVKTSDYTATVGGETVTIPAEDARYQSGLVAYTGLGVGLPSLGLTPPNEDGEWTMTAVTVGSSTASWSPTLRVMLGAGTVEGTYKGTITHSVA